MKRITIKNSNDKQLACAAINMLDEGEEHSIVIDGEMITFGEFTLEPFPKVVDDAPPSYWLSHESGEGMQVWAGQMYAIIAELWKEF